MSTCVWSPAGFSLWYAINPFAAAPVAVAAVDIAADLEATVTSARAATAPIRRVILVLVMIPPTSEGRGRALPVRHDLTASLRRLSTASLRCCPWPAPMAISPGACGDVDDG